MLKESPEDEQSGPGTPHFRSRLLRAGQLLHSGIWKQAAPYMRSTLVAALPGMGAVDWRLRTCGLGRTTRSQPVLKTIHQG